MPRASVGRNAANLDVPPSNLSCRSFQSPVDYDTTEYVSRIWNKPRIQLIPLPEPIRYRKYPDLLHGKQNTIKARLWFISARNENAFHTYVSQLTDDALAQLPAAPRSQAGIQVDRLSDSKRALARGAYRLGLATTGDGVGPAFLESDQRHTVTRSGKTSGHRRAPSGPVDTTQYLDLARTGARRWPAECLGPPGQSRPWGHGVVAIWRPTRPAL